VSVHRNRNNNRPIAAGLIVVAAACVGLAIFYLTVKSTFLATHYGTQPKHSLIFGGLGVLALVGASIAWRSRT